MASILADFLDVLDGPIVDAVEAGPLCKILIKVVSHLAVADDVPIHTALVNLELDAIVRGNLDLTDVGGIAVRA